MTSRLDPAVAAVRLAVRRECDDLEPGARVVVGVSGGADSMALLSAAVFEARKHSWSVDAVVIDHGLQDGSATLAFEVARRAAAMGCDAVDVIAVQVGRRGGVEGAAREARYAALTAYADEREAVLLVGHTRDDQAETVLLGLARGSGTRSLAGMAVRRERLRRPLLGLSRATTHQACAAEGLDVWTDPHNTDPRFGRARVRHRVLPLLEAELGPGVAEALARSGWLARDDADALDLWAATVYDAARDDSGALDVARIAAAPAAVRRRVLRRAAVAAGTPPGDLTADHLVAVDRLVTSWHGQRGIDLPGSIVAVREEGSLTMRLRPVAG